MECFHRHVAPTVFAFLVVLCGTGTLEPARAQSTGGALGPTPSSLLLPSPTLANAQPVTNSSTQGAVLTSIASPAIGLPNQPGAEAVPSMGSQTPTYMGYTHRSRDLQPTASLQTPTGLPPFPFRPPVGLPFSRPRPPTGNPFLRPRPPPGNPFLRPGPPTGIPFLRPRPPPGNPFLRPGPPTGIPFLRLRPPPGNPFLVPRPPTGIPFLGPRPPSGFPLLPTRFCPPVGPHRLGPPGCPLSPHHPPTATSHPHPHDKSFPVFLPLPQSIFEAISTESFPTSIPVITQAPPTLQSVTSFLLNLTRWNCTPAVAVFDDEIGTDWNDQVHTIFLEHFQWGRKLQKFSCSNRCGSNERNAETIDKPYRSHPVRCFCDKLCVEFGDCCFDFFRMCRHLANPRRQIPSSNELCRSDKDRFGPRAIGYAVWSTCPKNWSDPIVHHKCQNENQSDLLNNLPVFDKDSRITYRNIFCARCNGAVNTRYWKLHADCKRWFNTTGLPLEDLMRIVDANCYMTIRISWLQYLKKCIPRFQDCSRVSQEKNDMNCQSQCLGYAFPVCVKENGKLIRYRNIQCALCNGIKPIYLEIDCIFGSWGPTPPLSILFDFTSSFQSSIEVIDRKMNMPRNIQQSWSCDPDEVYDPYTGKCKKIVDFYMEKASNGTQFVETELRNPEVVMENKTKLHLNCTFIAFNESDYLELPNGAVHVKPHHKVYGNTSYKIHANKLFLCVNFSRNATVLVVAKQHSIGYIKPAASPLQIMTSIGCIASMVSLILLLTTYTFFTELRNLPGRIIINLSLSLLFYQGVFLGAVKTVSHERCKIVAILLHFFVLSSFTWMNIMAYDVHKTFTSSGGGRGSSHQAQHTTRFVRYCLYGWGAPAIVVSTFVIIDEFLSKGFVGYGQGQAYCFIAEPKAILSSFIVPVALILVFNLFALVHTVLYIVKTRKRTHKVTNQQHSTGVALICVKMASVMGVTWILGIAANVHALSFLWYPYVVLNSLQGVFIFLSFAASGRSLELYRAKISILRNRCFQKASRNKERSKNIVKPSQKTWSLDSRDCEETPL